MTSSKQLVSIIVPVYNVREYLDDCIDSIEAQEYKNIEIIFIDDGSTDGSGKILDNRCENNTNYVVVHQDNRGVSVARNVGIEQSKGDFITFIDADDIITVDYIKTLVSMIDNNGDVSMCSYVQVSSSDEMNHLNRRNGSHEIKRFDTEHTMEEIVYGRILDSGPFCKLFRRKVIGSMRYNEKLKIGEDLDFLCRVFLSKKITTIYTERSLYGYRIRQDSVMNDKYSSRYRDYLDLVDDLGKRLVMIYPKLRKAINYRLFGIASFGITKIGSARKQFIDDYKLYNHILRRYSASILFDSRSSCKNKILALGYTVSPKITSWIRCNIRSL